MMQAQTPRYSGHRPPLELSPHSSRLHPDHDPDNDAADSDDGQSGDDPDNDDDQHEVVRLGKRKRPISVS